MRLRIRGVRRSLTSFRRIVTRHIAPPYPYRDFPALEHVHVPQAALHSNRFDLLRALAVPHHGTVAEIGVAFGDFSAFLIETLEPREFIAIDLFNLHAQSKLWDMNVREVLEGDSHRTFYQRRLSASGCIVTIREGTSHIELARFPDDYFDLIYIDADHSYEAVTRDADAARRKLKPGGFMIFNSIVRVDLSWH